MKRALRVAERLDFAVGDDRQLARSPFQISFPSSQLAMWNWQWAMKYSAIWLT